MKSVLACFSLLLGICIGCAQGVPSPEAQIKSTSMAAPAEMREGITVLGYNAGGELVELKKGTNELICIADDPAQKGFNAACYYKDLEPFMARGRELKQQGKNFQEIFDIREEEVKSGKLKIPHGSGLFVLSGPDEVYNAETGEVTGAHLRSVVYIPYATTETTGLPLKPAAPGMPWIMDPGTHRAHIMITPPKPN